MSEGMLIAVAPVPLWPVDNGYSLRVTGILARLVERWDTILVSPASPAGADRGADMKLRDHVTVDLGGNVATMPWQLDIEPLKAVMNDVLRVAKPDVALLWAGTEVLGFGNDFVPAVADRIDSATLATFRMTRGEQSLSKRVRMSARAALYERRVVRGMSATIVVGEDDARMLRRISGRDTVHVVPNGVDLTPIPAPTSQSVVPTVIFTGVMNFRPNVEAAIGFAHEVWPLVRASTPEARFVIAGRQPRDSILALAGLPGVEVLPDVVDLRAELHKAWVAVAPMRSGCGIKNKVLEAWACGKPVVMSSIAANGLAPGHRQASSVADDPRQVADAVVRLIRDGETRNRLGRFGHALVAEHHSWAGAAGRVSELLRAAATGSPRDGVAPSPPGPRAGLSVG